VEEDRTELLSEIAELQDRVEQLESDNGLLRAELERYYQRME